MASEKTKTARSELTLLAMLIFLMAMGYSVFQYSLIKKHEQTVDDLKSNGQFIEDLITEEIDRVSVLGDLLSQMPRLSRTLKAGLDSPLSLETSRYFQQTNDKVGISAIYLMDRQGLTLSSSNYDTEVSFVGKNYGFRPYFKNAILNGADSFLAIGATTQKLGYFISRAIKDGNAVQGVLVLRLDFSKLIDFAEDIDTDLLMKDANQIVFLSTIKKYNLGLMGPLPHDQRQRITETRKYPLHQLTDLNNQHFVQNAIPLLKLNKMKFVYHEHQIASPDWTVLMMRPFQPIHNTAVINGVLCVSLLFGAGLIFLQIKARQGDKARLQTIVDNLPIGVFLINKDKRIILANAEASAVLNIFADKFVSKRISFASLIERATQKGTTDLLLQCFTFLDESKNDLQVIEAVRRDGGRLEMRLTRLKDGHYICAINDITGHKLVEETAIRNENYLKTLLTNLEQGVMVMNEDLNIVFYNQAYFDLLGLPEHMRNRSINYEDVIRYMAERGDYGEEDIDLEIENRLDLTRSFKPKLYERDRYGGGSLQVSGKPIVQNGTTLGYLTTFMDITEHKEMAQSLKKLANTDELTGLNNRRYFNHLLKNEVNRTERSGHALSVLVLDLDYFKKINDTYGHMNGDLVLKEFARNCMSVLREIDVMGRMGGEEFAIFLPETNREGSEVLAERIRQQTHDLVIQSLDAQAISITVSIGIATYDTLSGDDSLEKFLHRADQALYRAKRDGRNRVR